MTVLISTEMEIRACEACGVLFPVTNDINENECFCAKHRKDTIK